ncbi:hypothetical protein [Streptococcus oralis]|jgi:hypothetical protein|uniref:hypothetical protein n=1 Tax=Streptococcus oralis TaxID=1303 RepID=UPI002284815F|nr:hypothetical protein [Streptococcus oralis]MCY7098901.1 hypothetical protein [Streptococcus oralis]
MRRDISIIWLEDEMEDAFQDYLDIVKQAIKDKGYQLLKDNCYLCESIEEAREILDDSSKRIDFFISDFNLGEEYANGINNGIDFLNDVRSRENYKQFFILYSKNYVEIKETIITKIDRENNLGLLNNTMIINLSSPSDEVIKRDFQKAVEISLSKWDELNALRGEYMYENAEMEYLLRSKCPGYPKDKTYRDLVKSYFKNELQVDETLKRRDNKKYRNLVNIRDNWLLLIDRRNALAHVTEDYDSEKGYYIQSNNENCENTFSIYESNLDDERCKLLEVVVMVKDLLF